MRTYEELIQELDENQREAARIETNAVIAAGAGSGKTRVLAARYVHLVVKKGIPVDGILALTFTRKAAAEMYKRIYDTLREIDDDRAREAVDKFHLARIATLDSFCSSIARNACRSYGVTPDFRTDADEVRDIAEELALPFFLEHRKSQAIRQLSKRFRMAELPAKLFADTMIRYSSLSHPLDFAGYYEAQKKETEARIVSLSKAIIETMSAIASLPSAKGKTLASIKEAIPEIPEAPVTGDRESLKAFLFACVRLAACKKPGAVTDPVLVELKELFSAFKDTLHAEFLAVANWALNEDCIKETFALLAEFQDTFNRKKREAGILTFTDVARMAVDALANDIALRNVWKNAIQSIMIDEFQDDNELQRDLLFLIAEKADRDAKSPPLPEELEDGKLFFVGDEKQSIYRFRGADVSVFRALERDLDPERKHRAPELGTNYRSETALIDIFNRVFPYVFPDGIRDETGKRPLYEAEFLPIGAIKKNEDVSPSLDILLVPKENFDKEKPGVLSPEDTEANAVATRIRELVDAKTPVTGKDGKTAPCTFGDIAILFRSGTNQQSLERQLRDGGIPYQTENVRGLFTDAPVNDLYALLRLAVYPADNTAYATLLRSPFVGISDLGFARAILVRTIPAEKNLPLPPPFGEEIDPGLSADDLDRFERGRSLYRAIREDADRVSAAELVTRLWYDEGYRYALFAGPGLRHYAELYDYFFELARQADADGLSLAGFLDHIAGLMETGEKIEGLDIPVERSGGVSLMTVHKCKGLEFPVVFLVDAGSDGNGNRNSSPVYYSTESGISVNTGASDENESARDNWFYERDRDGDLRREIAETRRLLYVAMTRAGTRLFVSGTVSLKADATETPREGDALMELLAPWLESGSASDDDGTSVPKRQSFLRMILSAIVSEDAAGNTIPNVTVTEILPRTLESRARKADFKDLTTDAEIARRYDAIAKASYPPSPKNRYTATSLPSEEEYAGESPQQAQPTDSADPLDRLLARIGTSPADFGTYAHRAIEASFTGFPSFMPEELKATVDEMTGRFLASELGTLAQNVTWRESEYGFITRYTLEGRAVTVSGQMDLVFEKGEKVYVIDYKTDRVEDPSVHAAQLGVYRKAARELRGKPAETWLFYLRSGTARRVDE